MTRGTFYIFTPSTVYNTTEFNGDMYFEGCGKEAAEGMQKVDSPEDLLSFALTFNKNNHHYPVEEITISRMAEYERFLNMDNYFDSYSSDYVFIKNATGHDLLFTFKDGNYILPTDKSGVSYFGHSVDDEFPSNLNAFRPATADETIQDACSKYDVVLNEEDKNSILELINKESKPHLMRITGIYDNLESYAKEYVLTEKKLDSWIIPYFDFKKYAKDIDTSFMLQLNSGKVVFIKKIKTE